MSGEDRHAGEPKDKCRDLDHNSASGLPIAARYLLRERSQIRSNKNCMLAIPVFLRGRIPIPLFQPCFVAPGKWFRGRGLLLRLDDNIPTQGHAAGAGEGDSIMLDAILLMLGIGSCALVLVAFWGSELLGNEWRRHRR